MWYSLLKNNQGRKCKDIMDKTQEDRLSRPRRLAAKAIPLQSNCSSGSGDCSSTGAAVCCSSDTVDGCSLGSGHGCSMGLVCSSSPGVGIGRAVDREPGAGVGQVADGEPGASTAHQQSTRSRSCFVVLGSRVSMALGSLEPQHCQEPCFLVGNGLNASQVSQKGDPWESSEVTIGDSGI